MDDFDDLDTYIWVVIALLVAGGVIGLYYLTK